MFITERSIALRRLDSLFNLRTETEDRSTRSIGPRVSANVPNSQLKRTLFQAGLNLSPSLLVVSAVAIGFVSALLFSKFLSLYFLPFFFAAGYLFPFAWIQGKVRSRAAEFASEYPAVLLATASSLKVGLTPQLALERATNLLPEKSMVRTEVEQLRNSLAAGISKNQAVANFGASIAQPELELFRSAFSLALDNGGRFSPTLERLATVSKDRQTLIRTAQVSTSNMRMTANILLLLTPVIVLMVAARSDTFWETFINHPTANTISTIGILVIAGSISALRRMSNFKP